MFLGLGLSLCSPQPAASGAASPVNPTTLGLTNLVAAWDSRFGVTRDGTAVTSWQELVSNEETESAYELATGYSHNPTFVEDAGNGQPAVRFTRNEPSVKAQFLRLVNGFRAMANGMTVLVVLKTTDTKATANHSQNVPSTVLSESSVNTFNGGGMLNGAVAYTYFSGGWQEVTFGSGLNDGNVRVIGWSHSTADEVKAYSGSSQLGATVTGATYNATWMGYGTIGSGYRVENAPDPYGGDDGIDGDVMAVFVFSGEASSGDRTTVHEWAQEQFGAQ